MHRPHEVAVSSRKRPISCCCPKSDRHRRHHCVIVERHSCVVWSSALILSRGNGTSRIDGELSCLLLKSELLCYLTYQLSLTTRGCLIGSVQTLPFTEGDQEGFGLLTFHPDKVLLRSSISLQLKSSFPWWGTSSAWQRASSWQSACGQYGDETWRLTPRRLR